MQKHCGKKEARLSSASSVFLHTFVLQTSQFAFTLHSSCLAVFFHATTGTPPLWGLASCCKTDDFLQRGAAPAELPVLRPDPKPEKPGGIVWLGDGWTGLCCSPARRLTTSTPRLARMVSLRLATVDLGKGGLSPRDHVTPWEHADTLPLVSAGDPRGSGCATLQSSRIGGKARPLLKWGSRGQRGRGSGQEPPRAAAPGASSCCPPVPLPQRKGKLPRIPDPKDSLCRLGCPRAGTQLPGQHPPHPGSACTHRLPWVAARCVQSSTRTLHPCPWGAVWGRAPHEHPAHYFFSSIWSSRLWKICLKR